MRITHIVLTVFGVLFALLGLAFWAAPDVIAQNFGLDPVGAVGAATLRADLGGLFIASAILCLYGAWGQRRALLSAAFILLGAILAGRLLAAAITGAPPGVAASLVIEAAAAAALGVHIWQLKSRPDAAAPKPWQAAATIGVVAGLAVAALAFLQTPRIQYRLFEKGAVQLISQNNKALMKDDALRVAICGSSSPLPSHKRAKACVAVIAGGKIYVVDVGPESVENLVEWGVPLDNVGGVLLTHFHSDHIGDLGELNLQTWVQGRPGPLAVYGGPGVERVVAGFSEAYSLDQGYRTAHHGAGVADPATWPMAARPVTLSGPTGEVLKDGGLTITAIAIDHTPVRPAYAYRFDYKGRSVVVTGDGVARPSLAQASKGADLFVAEALSRPMIRTLQKTSAAAGRPRVSKIMGDIQSYHASPTEMAEAANQAGAKMLVLYHLIPAPDNPVLRRVFLDGMKDARKGRWDLADDGSLYTLPLNSSEVRVGRVPER